MDLLWWAVPLVLISFLWTLNEFLRGRLKEVISGILALLLFVLVGVAFLFSGWKWGLAALFGVFLLGNLFRPLALTIARRMVVHPDLGVERYQREQLEKTINDFGSDGYFQRRQVEAEEELAHRENTAANALRGEDVQAVLEQHGGSQRDLEALYDRVEVKGLPPRMRETVLGNAEFVDYFLANSAPGEFQDGYVRNVSGQEVSMTLSLWASSNPGGSQPR